MKWSLFFLIALFSFGIIPLRAADASNPPSTSGPQIINSPEHFYNDGLEAEARGDLADASLALRRALVLNPHFSQAREKLNELLGKIGIAIQPTWRTKLLSFCSPDYLVMIGSLLAWSAAFLVVWIFFTRYLGASESSKKRSYLLLIFLSLIFLLGSALAFLGTTLDPRTGASKIVIVLPKYDFKTSPEHREERPATTPLRSNPVENGPILASIPTGSLLFLQSRHGVWSYVKMESGLKGWIATSALQPLVPETK
ncbi:MAG: SH3 domain-containing protein [Chthoniobacterales bacterium]|nr:SH3 domain-containing protein [Chthoniobacterales bacterium]